MLGLVLVGNVNIRHYQLVIGAFSEQWEYRCENCRRLVVKLLWALSGRAARTASSCRPAWSEERRRGCWRLEGRTGPGLDTVTGVCSRWGPGQQTVGRVRPMWPWCRCPRGWSAPVAASQSWTAPARNIQPQPTSEYGRWVRRIITRAANDPSVFTIMEKAPNRPLVGPSPGWKHLLALSHLRHCAKQETKHCK